MKRTVVAIAGLCILLVLGYGFLVMIGIASFVEFDTQQNLVIDREQPFEIALGRGSGMDGLETIELDQTGRVTAYRYRWKPIEDEGRIDVWWETTTLNISDEALNKVLGALESNGVLKAHNGYHKRIVDGEQWVFRAQQGSREKSIYFNNNFPQFIKAFAKQLDRILDDAGLDSATWEIVSEDKAWKHDKDLWESLR